MARPRRNLGVDGEKKVHDLAIAGHGPELIRRELEKIGVYADRKTIGTRIKEYVPPDPSGPWDLRDSDPEDARLILDAVRVRAATWLALRSALSGWGPRPPDFASLPRGMAVWVAKIRVCAPNLPPDIVVSLAGFARAAEITSDPKAHRDLTLFLAFRPWESVLAAEAYEGFLESGAAAAPLYLGCWWRDLLPEHLAVAGRADEAR